MVLRSDRETGIGAPFSRSYHPHRSPPLGAYPKEGTGVPVTCVDLASGQHLKGMEPLWRKKWWIQSETMAGSTRKAPQGIYHSLGTARDYASLKSYSERSISSIYFPTAMSINSSMKRSIGSQRSNRTRYLISLAEGASGPFLSVACTISENDSHQAGFHQTPQ